ncbi:E3 ubiquitin-protein ligase parkin isoform X2 [Poecilia latipinna]|uniref:E3 ubiquitin-protein ligase parkin isoform X2 n=1 Tax=Poecilia latipinna TaxID=48699 RepID=UPI00072E67B7|nr:PREDICTED: E3 ubiquitin-protein ligase parkin isoform X2 [Poecilia latipinna]
MIVFVRFNRGPGVAVELSAAARVAELKEIVASQQGVPAQALRVLFAGRELQSSASLQGCDLPEQSTVHVVLPPPGSIHLLPLAARGTRLTRLDLSSSRLAPLEGGIGGGDEDQRTEQQAAAPKGVCSTFFVYCKRCSSIQSGKLRVRCRRCRQMALTLSRGPSCWDDVLLPGRIHGVCQVEGCHGNEAEFYMKCASHPTSEDDVSVALDLVLSNTRGVPCIGCTDIRDVVLVFQCSDRHVICLDCFQRYCQTRLNERQFIYDAVIGYSLPCAAGCENSLIRELHHFRVLGDDQYGRYLQYGAEEFLLTAGGVLCPSPGCGAGLLPPEGSRRVECDRRLGCGFVFCRDCREGFHEGPCEGPAAPPPGDACQGFVVGDEASQRGRWDQASLQLIQESTRRCPRCLVPVERNGGCMHMQCTQCRAEWCWLCGAPWNRECMGNHWFG